MYGQESTKLSEAPSAETIGARKERPRQRDPTFGGWKPVIGPRPPPVDSRYRHKGQNRQSQTICIPVTYRPSLKSTSLPYSRMKYNNLITGMLEISANLGFICGSGLRSSLERTQIAQASLLERAAIVIFLCRLRAGPCSTQPDEHSHVLLFNTTWYSVFSQLLLGSLCGEVVFFLSCLPVSLSVYHCFCDPLPTKHD